MKTSRGPLLMISLGLALWAPCSTGSCVNDILAAKIRSYRAVRVLHDAEGVFVYQAFSEQISTAAVKNQTFLKGSGFKYGRMTWIKLSLPWMLYRSDFGRAKNQERVLKIKITHAFFNQLLDQSIASSFDQRAYGSEAAWRQKLALSDVVSQWDPDRDYDLNKVPGRHVLQLGFRGQAVELYVKSGILKIEDVTDLARRSAVDPERTVGKSGLPYEEEYELNDDVRYKLLMDRRDSNI